MNQQIQKNRLLQQENLQLKSEMDRYDAHAWISPGTLFVQAFVDLSIHLFIIFLLPLTSG